MSSQQDTLMSDLESRATRRQAVWELLSDGQWHNTMQINGLFTGGSEGCRRLRELRKEVKEGKHHPWIDVEKRRQAESSQFEYRLVKRAVPEHCAPMPLLSLMEAE